MALWNEKPMSASAGSAVTPSAPLPERSLPERNTSDPALAVSPRRPTPKTSSEGGESVIAANLTIEGKIEGSGNVRMAGRFKGDVRIDGNFSIEAGAHLTGQVLASIVVVGGELQGNIESAKRVDVQEGGVRPKSAGRTRRSRLSPAWWAAAASHERRSGWHLRRDSNMSALQGGRPAERQYLSRVPAPSALQFRECGTASGVGIGHANRRIDSPHRARRELRILRGNLDYQRARRENCTPRGRRRRADARREAQIQLLGRLDAGTRRRAQAKLISAEIG